ncbi:dCTP deaminase [Bradyrhizobium sp. NFR13]|uniref:dCTP deaminase n=1 Tax=Bradyrhizobium sp. NFR13 TaxID=1566285 RepID=UPI0008F126BD|nr:dCTP deaminase [Bradyrhizobium sp. NFR13]SFM29594.1 dCTP deaminase [Bradyrhizobium sp. NFR13]
MLDCVELARKLRLGNDADPNGLCIVPEPSICEIEKSGEASVTLRLGRWFVSLRQSSQTFFDTDIDHAEHENEARASKNYFVPFGKEFVLHPGRFVLSSTLEWMKFPPTLGGYVGGKSTWARRGLIIETAAGIHPGFNGCLTLELTNVGEVPIKIRPGMKICQIFLHAIPEGKAHSSGLLTGRRRPYLGKVKGDPILKSLQGDG